MEKKIDCKYGSRKYPIRTKKGRLIKCKKKPRGK